MKIITRIIANSQFPWKPARTAVLKSVRQALYPTHCKGNAPPVISKIMALVGAGLQTNIPAFTISC